MRQSSYRWVSRATTLHNIPYQNSWRGFPGGALALGLGLSGCGPLHFAWLTDTGGLSLSTATLALPPTSLDGRASGEVVVSHARDRRARVRVMGVGADTGAPDAGFRASPAVLDLDPGGSATLTVSYGAEGRVGDAEAAWTVQVDGAAAGLSLAATAQALADFDGDGHRHPLDGGDDCDDGDASVSPSAPESWYDGVDDDCDGNDADRDLDGYDAEAVGGADCDDSDAAVHPGAEDAWYDGVDSDCDGNEADQDGDGHAADFAGGDDCDDSDPTVSPSDADPYDLVDNDCDGVFDEDALPTGAVWWAEWSASPETPGGAWAELRARDWRPWQLQGWAVTDAGGAASLLPAHELAPGASAVLCEDATVADSLGIPCDLELAPWPDLLGVEGALELGPPGIPVDRVAWDATWPIASDTSTQLDQALLDAGGLDATTNDSAGAWCLSEVDGGAVGGSPGAANTPCPSATRRR